MSVSPQASPESVPLCVDLDGTLIRTDSLYEALCVRMKTRPLSLLGLPLWIARGKAFTKERVSSGIDVRADLLPYNQELLEFLRSEKSAGRRLVLVTAADLSLARQVGDHLGIFDEILSSDGKRNLSGRVKAEALKERFGDRAFDYIGNDPIDKAVWGSAREALVASSCPAFVEEIKREFKVSRVFPGQRPGFGPLLRAMRPHQWVKNFLLFLPLIMAHRVFELDLAWRSVLSFVFFSLCASSVYLLNDLCDLPSDRRHSSKRNRPLAAGELSLLRALVAIPILLCLSFAGAGLLLPVRFLGTLTIYFAFTLAYSLYLKQMIALDIIALSVLYTIRILAGGHAAEVPVSEWMLAFSMFFFLSLACLKRFSELMKLRKSDQSSAHGRGYLSGDLELVSQFGSSSAYLSVLVLAFYISSPEVSRLYANPQALWFVCPVLLYWLSRVWILAHRGEVNEDPILFAITDRASYGTGIVCGLLLLIATYG